MKTQLTCAAAGHDLLCQYSLVLALTEQPARGLHDARLRVSYELELPGALADRGRRRHRQREASRPDGLDKAERDAKSRHRACCGGGVAALAAEQAGEHGNGAHDIGDAGDGEHGIRQR